MNLLVVIPIRNVKPWSYQLDHYIDPRHCLVVDDASINNCGCSFKKQGATVLRLDRHVGVSGAILAGIKWGYSRGFDTFVTMDGDGQHHPKHIEEFSKILDLGADIVLGDRFSSGCTVPAHKKAANYLVSCLFKDKFGVFVPDVMCGFRGYSRSFLDAYILEADKNSYCMISDVLAFALSKKIDLAYVDVDPIYFSDDPLITKEEEVEALVRVMRHWNFSFSLINDIENLFMLDDKDSMLLSVGYSVFNIIRRYCVRGFEVGIISDDSDTDFHINLKPDINKKLKYIYERITRG